MTHLIRHVPGDVPRTAHADERAFRRQRPRCTLSLSIRREPYRGYPGCSPRAERPAPVTATEDSYFDCLHRLIEAPVA
jgi:hypothetical protein